MRAVTVDPEAKTVTAQGGCIWEDVDATAGTYGLVTVGGTVKHTGIGGLTLGGGYGWLSGQYGLTIDQLLSVEMVLANGQIITTSASEKPDLFWAIRGAGQSFGVAPSFTFRAHEQKDPVFASTMTFTPDKIPAAVALANRRSSEAEAFFNPLFDLEPVMNTTAMITYPRLNAMLNPVAGPGGRKFTKGASFIPPVRADFMLSLFDNFTGFVREVPDASGSLLLVEFFNQDKICQTSNRATAFAYRDFYGNVMAGPKWHDEANDGRCRQWARDVTDLLRREMEAAKIARQVKAGNGRRGPVWEL
ncbi:MAG: hypothetical protein Q9177_005155 [Variospora cf. flavescens]